MDSRSYSEQELFWSGEFGDEYTDRNVGAEQIASNIALFSEALSGASEIDSVVELGSNKGLNLSALGTLYPSQVRYGIEINPIAASELRENQDCDCVIESSIRDANIERKFDLVLCKGILIHQPPSDLQTVYSKIAAWAQKYILFAEYYNRVPTKINYRGHENKLFKRDFAGEFLDRNPDFRLLKTGFSYHKHPSFPADDLTWFLMEKV